MEKIDFRTDILPLKNGLFRLALRITLNRAEAEDVVQETMLRVWSRRDKWGEIESIEAFCMRICRNLALDKVKRAGSKTLSIDGKAPPETGVAEGGEDTSLAANPQRQAERQDSIAIVRRIIDSLPEKQRTIIHLREIEGKAYKEIAAMLDISEEQVKVGLFRARQTIKQRYTETENYGL